MARRGFYAPNSKPSKLDGWRKDMVMRAVGAVALHGGTMAGRHLGGILGLSPRGLRNILIRPGSPFAVEIRMGERNRGEAWYKLDQSRLPAPPAPPPLRLTANRAPVGPVQRGG